MHKCVLGCLCVTCGVGVGVVSVDMCERGRERVDGTHGVASCQLCVLFVCV